MGSFLTSVKDEEKYLISKIQKISEPLQKIKQYYGLFKSVCDSFLILKNQFVQIFEQSSKEKLQIFDKQSTGKIDGLQIFCGLIAFASNCTFKAKLKFLFNIFDFNSIKKISFVDLEYMTLCICNSTYKILNKNAKANQSQIVQWLKKYLSQKQRIHITKLYDFCMKSIQVKAFFSLIKSFGIDQKGTSSNHQLVKKIGKRILDNYEQIQKIQTKRQIQDNYQWYKNLSQKITNPFKTSHNYASQLSWIYGIKTEPIVKPFIIIGNQILYTTSTLMILYNTQINKQRFYKNHQHQISCFTFSQQKSIVISSDQGPYPKIHIWDYKNLENKAIIRTYHPKGILLMQIISSPFSIGNNGYSNQQLLITVGYFQKTNIVIYNLIQKTKMTDPFDSTSKLTYSILYSFSFSEMVMGITPIFTYLDYEQMIFNMNVNCCFVALTQKSLYLVQLVSNDDSSLIKDQKSSTQTSQMIYQYVYKQSSPITSAISIYLSVQNPLLKCFFSQQTLSVCIISGHQNGTVRIVFYNNQGNFSQQLLIEPQTQNQNMKPEPISHIDYNEQFFFIAYGNSIAVYNWSYIHSRQSQSRIINIDQNPQITLSSSEIQFFNLNKNDDFMIIMSKEGDFIKVSNRQIVYQQMNFVELEQIKKIKTLVKLEGSSKSMCLLEKNQDQYLIYIVNQMKKILIINPLSHEVQNIWEISSDDQITVIDAIYTDEDVLYFVCGCKSGKLYIRIGLQESPKFYDCSSEILQVKISRDASYLVVTTIQKYLFFFTHINKNFTSPRKLHFQNQIPICINFLDNNKFFLVSTSAKNVYLVQIPQLKHKNIHKQNEKINISKMQISYPNILQQTQKKIIYSKGFLGGQLKFYIIALCTGEIRYFQNGTNIQNFSFVSFFTHQSHISNLCIVDNQQTFYSLGKYDNSLIQWSVEKIKSLENVPSSIKAQNQKNQAEYQAEFLTIQELSNYHQLVNSSKPQDLYLFLGTKISKLNESLAISLNSLKSSSYQQQNQKIKQNQRQIKSFSKNSQSKTISNKQLQAQNENDNNKKLALRQPNLSLQLFSIFGAQCYKKNSIRYLLSFDSPKNKNSQFIIHYSSKFIIKTNLRTKQQQILQDAKYKISCFTISYYKKINSPQESNSSNFQSYSILFSICQQKPSIYIDSCYNKLKTTHELGIIHLQSYKNFLISYGLLEKLKSYSINFHNFKTKQLLFVRTTNIQIYQIILLNQNTFISLNEIRIWKNFYPSQKIGYATAACPMKLEFFEDNNSFQDVDVCLGTDFGNISMMNKHGIYTIVNKAHEGDVTNIKLIKSYNHSNLAYNSRHSVFSFELITVGKDSKIKIWNQVFQCKLMINFQDEILSKMAYLIDNGNQNTSQSSNNFKRKQFNPNQQRKQSEEQQILSNNQHQNNDFFDDNDSNFQTQNIGLKFYKRSNDKTKLKIRGIDYININMPFQSNELLSNSQNNAQSRMNEKASNSLNKQNTFNLKNNRNKSLINKKILVSVSNGSIYEINLSAKNINKIKHNRKQKKTYQFSQQQKQKQQQFLQEEDQQDSIEENSLDINQMSDYQINQDLKQNSDNSPNLKLSNKFFDNNGLKQLSSDKKYQGALSVKNYEYEKQITKILQAHSSDIHICPFSLQNQIQSRNNCETQKNQKYMNNSVNLTSSNSQYSNQIEGKIFQRFLQFALHPQLPIIASIGNDDKLLFREYESSQILGSFIVEKNSNHKNKLKFKCYERNRIRCLKFSKKGHLIALGYQNGQIKLFTLIIKLKDEKIISLDLVFSQKFKRKQNSYPVSVLNIEFSQKSTYFSASFLPQFQNTQNNSSSTQKKQNNKNEESSSLSMRQTSYIEIYKIKQQHAQTIQEIYYNLYDKIQIKNQDKYSPKYQKCVYTMTFSTTNNGDAVLVLFEQYINSFKIRINYPIKSKYSVYVIQEKNFLKKQFSINWSKIPFHNSVNFHQISNFQNIGENVNSEIKKNGQSDLQNKNDDPYKNDITKSEQNQLMITSMVFYKDFIIYGGSHGKIHLVKNSALIVQKPIEQYRQIQMALSKTYSTQISFINQIQISEATLKNKIVGNTNEKVVYLFVSGVLDQSVAIFKLIQEQCKNDLDYQNYMIDIKDPNQVYLTENKFFEFVNNVQPLREEIQQLLVDVEKDSFSQDKQDMSLQIIKVLGRRAFDRRNNIFSDKNNLIYIIGPNLVIYEQQTKQQRILPSDPNPYSSGPQISTLYYSKKQNLLILATQQEKCRLFVWDIRAQICLSQLEVDCSIIYNVRLSENTNLEGIAVFYGINQLYQMTISVIDWKNKKIIAKNTMIHTGVWKIKDLHILNRPYNCHSQISITSQSNSIFQNSSPFSKQISFLTCGVQHLSLWKVKCETLVEKHFINMPSRVTFMVVKQISQNVILTGCDKGCIYFFSNYQCVKQVKVHTGIIRSMQIIKIQEKIHLNNQIYLLTGGLDSQVILSKISMKDHQLQIISTKSVNPTHNVNSLNSDNSNQNSNQEKQTYSQNAQQGQGVYLTQYDIQSLCIKSIQVRKVSSNQISYQRNIGQFTTKHKQKGQKLNQSEQQQKQRQRQSVHENQNYKQNQYNVNRTKSNFNNFKNSDSNSEDKLQKLEKLIIYFYIGTRSGDIYQTSIEIFKESQNQLPTININPYISLVQFAQINQILYGQDHQTIVSLVFNNSPIDQLLYTLTITGKLDVWNLTTFSKIFTYKFMKKAKKIFLYKQDLIICFQKEIIFVELEISTKKQGKRKIRIKQQKTLNFEGTISQCCFSQAQKYLAVAIHKNESNQILIYEIQKKVPLYHSPILKYQIQYLDFSTDEKYVLFKDKFQQIGMIYLVTLKRINTIFVEMKIQWQSEGLRISPKVQPIYNSYNCENRITTINRLKNNSSSKNLLNQSQNDIQNKSFIIVGDQMGTLRIFTYPIEDDRLGELHTHCYTLHMNNINNIKQHKNLKFVATTSVYDRSLIIWGKTFNQRKQ